MNEAEREKLHLKFVKALWKTDALLQHQAALNEIRDLIKELYETLTADDAKLRIRKNLRKFNGITQLKHSTQPKHLEKQAAEKQT